MEKVMYIASGQIVADYLKSKGLNNVYAFNEAMCEGKTTFDIRSQEFCQKRVEAYEIENNEYIPFNKTLPNILETNIIELFFDYDMFCVINTITLLAYLEQINFKGEITFHLIARDGKANIIKSFPINLGHFRHIYKTVLIERKLMTTGIEHLDKGIKLYLEYKKQDNEIIRYIKNNSLLSKIELCKMIMKEFPNYGIGDKSIMKLINLYVKK